MPEALANPADRLMTIRGLIARFTQQEDLNFLLTNRIPRAALTRFMGWFSKIENPLVRDASIACWRLFSDLDLSEAKKTEFKSLHDCFTRELRPGLRPADPDPSVVASPSDGIIGAFGKIADTELFQIKGAPYSLLDLLGDPALVEQHRNGRFLTLRLTSSMYHRFHAPYDARIERVTFIHGDVWNVNPIALKRVERLFCKNERAVLQTRLVVRRGADAGAGRRHSGRQHPAAFPRCHAQRAEQGTDGVRLRCAGCSKGDELGWFEHGSTIIVLAPENFEFADNVAEGARIRAGEPLLRKPQV